MDDDFINYVGSDPAGEYPIPEAMAPELQTGDREDDDGIATVLSQNAVANLPTDADPTTVPVSSVDPDQYEPLKPVPQPTRVVASKFTVTPGAAPILVLGADPQRVCLRIAMMSLGSAAAGAASDPIIWSHEKNLAADYNNAATVFTDFPDDSAHTGPVYVAAPPVMNGGSVTGADCVVYIRAVTR